MCDILKKYGLKCTFNICSGTMSNAKAGGHHLTFDEAKEAYFSGGHEVACHGYSHPYLKRLPASQTVYEVIRDREMLEKQFGTIIRGFAYPGSAYDDNVVDGLRSCGIAYARGGNDSFEFTLPTDFLRMRPTIRHANPRLMELAHKFVEQKVTYDPIMFLLMGHSYEFERDNNWHVIEEFAEFMGDRNDIWYATTIQIYEYMEAFERLIWSADMKKVYNPSLIKLWMHCDGNIVSVSPGETVILRK